MAILISIGLSSSMKAWLNAEPRKTQEIVEHISNCNYFSERYRRPIKYVELQLTERTAVCVSNDDGTVIKEIPFGLTTEDLIDWIGTYMLCYGEICEEAIHYADIFAL